MQKDDTNIDWIWTDAWLLQAIHLATGDRNTGADLKGILMMGDGINHAIFTVAELKQGLEKLTAIDYVRIASNRFFLTDKFLNAYSLISDKAKTLLKATAQLDILLKANPVDKSMINKIGSNIISKSRVNNAYLQYQQQFGH